MNKNKLMSGILVASFVLVAAGVAVTAEAAPKGNAWGYYNNPGNSAFGRSHNKHYVAPGIRWAGHNFEDMDALVEYLREYLRVLQQLRERNYENSEIQITTRAATGVGDDQATLRGEIDFNDSDWAYVWFQYGETASSLNEDTSRVKLEDDEDELFEREVDDLQEGERYYFRAVGEDDDGDKDYGSIRSFTTDGDTNNDSEIEIVTRSAVDIEDDRATLRGEVDFNASDYAYVWFEYGESASDLDEDTSRVKLDDNDDEQFEREVSDLKDDERYYFRAVGEDEDGAKEYGSIRTFVTDEDVSDQEPVATTQSAHEVTDDSVELNGEVDMNDFDNGVVFFVYGTNENDIGDVADDFDTYDDVSENKVRVDTDLDNAGDYEADLTGLEADTTYYYVIGVEYKDGGDLIELGEVREFTTDDA